MNFVLPASGNYMRSEAGLKYDRDMLAGTEWEEKGLEYQIFCLHTVWDTQVCFSPWLSYFLFFIQEVRRTLSGPDTVLISIVRDPVDVFESMWYYYGFSQNVGKSLEDFAKDVAMNPDIGRQGFDNRFGRNQTLFDFGLEHEHMNDTSKVDDKINSISEEFDLVMVSERFLDSKVLLAGLLGLSPSDAACLKLNSRNSSSKPVLDSQTRKVLSAMICL